MTAESFPPVVWRFFWPWRHHLLAAGHHFRLPLLLRGLAMPSEPVADAAEHAARIATAEAAIAEIERVQHSQAEGQQGADLYVVAAARIMEIYRQRSELAASRSIAGKADIQHVASEGL